MFADQMPDPGRVSRGRPLLVAALASTLAAGCAHGLLGGGQPSRSAQRFAAEAAAFKTVSFEEDFLDARLILQALPLGTAERTTLRTKLVAYLIGPIARLDANQAKSDPAL